MGEPFVDLSCNGRWECGGAGESERHPATVPGCIHSDLLAIGAIPDPWYRDQEKDIHWVCQKDWVYGHDLVVPEALLAYESLVLQCEGLDTLARVSINGVEVGRADNMFRTWRFDVKPFLRAGANRVEVRFDSPIPMMKAATARRRLPTWNVFHEDFAGRSYVRKMGCAFGWDWGLMAPTAGIWRPMTLQARDGRLEDLRIRQHHAGGVVRLEVSADCLGRGQAVRWRTFLAGQLLGEESVPCARGKVTAAMTIAQPQLWWPNGMGEQPLYEVEVELLDGGGVVLDRARRRIGLRRLELVRQGDRFGESFRFRVNGRDFFAKGSNWIPCDVFPSRISDETYRRLIQSAAEAHMNMLRVWGGGIYEADLFYNLCDEHGILVWQDFMFACSTYPTFDAEWMDNVKAEAVDNVRRLRHHACLALWCGNNELEQGLVQDQWTDSAMSWSDYRPLFDVLLADIVEREDGATAYWPSSPHTPGPNRADFNDATIGDAHAWSVWFGGQSFEAQRTWSYRFMSEFGFQSFPELRSVEAYTAPEDRTLTTWVMDYHQRSGPGNQTIFKYLLDWFQPPKDFESSLWLSQLTQALCIQYAAEHARRLQGHMDGLLYWQINDLWPGATWSSIDVYLRWKALHYFAKRFFTPVLVSGLEDAASSTVAIHLSNHLPHEVNVQVRWLATDAGGRPRGQGVQTVTIPSQCNQLITTLDCRALRVEGGTTRQPLAIAPGISAPITGDRDLMIWLQASIEGREVSRNLALFARPKHLLLQRPQFAVDLAPDEQAEGSSGRPAAYRIRLTSSTAAPWTRLELEGEEARFSDNFLHLCPGLPAEVLVWPGRAMTLGEVRAALRIVPLIDLWS
jgi:beta-mannosidase